MYPATSATQRSCEVEPGVRGPSATCFSTCAYSESAQTATVRMVSVLMADVCAVEFPLLPVHEHSTAAPEVRHIAVYSNMTGKTASFFRNVSIFCKINPFTPHMQEFEQDVQICR